MGNAGFCPSTVVVGGGAAAAAPPCPHCLGFRVGLDKQQPLARATAVAKTMIVERLVSLHVLVA